MGGLLLWVSMLRYYENARGYNIMINTMQNSIFIVFKALAGVFPIFVGFAILGMCLFWKSKRFDSLSSSLFCLFSLMHGDMIYEAEYDLKNVNRTIAQLYLYIFVSFSILVILNVFVIIVEDGYVMSKYQKPNDWLKMPTTPAQIQNGKLLIESNDYRQIAHGHKL